MNLTPSCGLFKYVSIFQAYGSDGRPLQSDLGRAMTPSLAYDAYVAFHHLMGRAALDAAIPNHDLIKALCSGFDEKDAIRPATFAHFRLVSGQLGNCFTTFKTCLMSM